MCDMEEDYCSKSAEQAMVGCQSCGGSGVVRGSTTVVCTACKGTGRLLEEHCPACRGLEFQVVEVDTPCNQCDGDGFVPLRGD
jgi:DnaJ-class molecular chaperone